MPEQQFSIFEEAQCADAELYRIVAILQGDWYKFSVGNQNTIVAVINAVNS